MFPFFLSFFFRVTEVRRFAVQSRVTGQDESIAVDGISGVYFWGSGIFIIPTRLVQRSSRLFTTLGLQAFMACFQPT